MKNRAVFNNIIQVDGPTFHEKILQDNNLPRSYFLTNLTTARLCGDLSQKNGAIYHTVPEVHLTHFKCFELSYNAFRG